MNTETIFETDDILLASFLIVNGIKLIETVQNYPRHFTFHLDNPDKCNELKRAYLSGAESPAIQLFNMREQLLNEIKGRNRDGNSYGKR